MTMQCTVHVQVVSNQPCEMLPHQYICILTPYWWRHNLIMTKFNNNLSELLTQAQK